MLAVSDLRGAGGDGEEHRGLVVPMVPPESIGVEIGLELVTSDLMVDTVNAALHETPEAFHRVRVDIAGHVDGSGMVDSLVAKALLLQAVVAGVLVCVHHAGWREVQNSHRPSLTKKTDTD